MHLSAVLSIVSLKPLHVGYFCKGRWYYLVLSNYDTDLVSEALVHNKVDVFRTAVDLHHQFGLRVDIVTDHAQSFRLLRKIDRLRDVLAEVLSQMPIHIVVLCIGIQFHRLWKLESQIEDVLDFGELLKKIAFEQLVGSLSFISSDLGEWLVQFKVIEQLEKDAELIRILKLDEFRLIIDRDFW